MKVAGFNELSPYYDDQHCPMGFSRSGHFTLMQADLIERYGQQLLGLEKGDLKPETKEQKQFVAVVKGEQLPSTLLEKAWAQYYKLRFNTCAINPFGRAKPNVDDDDMDSSDDDDL